MFIPMCIGNTKLKPVRRRSIPVYPYVYREHTQVRLAYGLADGLSLCV